MPIDWEGDWNQVESALIEGNLRGCNNDNDRADLATHIAGEVVDFAREHGCFEAWIEGIPTHAAYDITTIAGIDLVVRAELRREGLDLNTAHMATGRKLFLGRVPSKRTEGRKINIKREFILPAFEGLESPLTEKWQDDVRDAFVAVQLGLKHHGGFVYANAEAA